MYERLIFSFRLLSFYVYVHRAHAWCLERPEEGIGAPGTRVMGGCVSTPGDMLAFKPRSSARVTRAFNH